MGRAPCCEKMGLKKGPWIPEEDKILIDYIQKYGHGNWRALPKQAGLMRCGKSCRLRWTNYLRPDIKRGNFTSEEEETILKSHEMLGNRWSAIAARLPGRTDNEIKNVWHSHLKKRQQKQATKLHSITVPKCDSDPARQLESVNSSSPTSCPGLESPGYAQTSPSSCDFSSGTYSSIVTVTGETHNKDEHVDSLESLPQFPTCPGLESSGYAPTSPQQSSSCDFSSGTEYSSVVTVTGETNNKDEHVDSLESLPEIDESFWSLDLLAFADELQPQFPSSSVDTMEPIYSYSSNVDDSMGFWYNVFIRAGGQQNYQNSNEFF